MLLEATERIGCGADVERCRAGNGAEEVTDVEGWDGAIDRHDEYIRDRGDAEVSLE